MIEPLTDQTDLSKPESFLGRSVGENNRYYIERCLGKGGMGSVYQATDRKLGKRVAVKRFNSALQSAPTSKDIGFRKRFERECVICAALTNENVVQVSDYGITMEDEPFYVMEYLDGKTLEQLLEEEGQLSIERSIQILIQVCHGLRPAHEGISFKTPDMCEEEQIQIVHRDLKPSNIFLVPTTTTERVKIIDFGVAKVQPLQGENPNVTNIFLGTYHYAAPEQLDCQDVIDARADIYCLGLILYEMLTGVDPFGLGDRGQRITGEAWIKAHLMKSVCPLRSQPGCEAISIDLENIILRCLEKHPDFRFGSVRELAEALEKVRSQLYPQSISRSIVKSVNRALLPFDHSIFLTYASLIKTLSQALKRSLLQTISQCLQAFNNAQFSRTYLSHTPKPRQPPTSVPITVVNVDLIDRCKSELTHYIGPTALLIINQTLLDTQYHEPHKFIESLANSIPDQASAHDFRQSFYQST